MALDGGVAVNAKRGRGQATTHSTIFNGHQTALMRNQHTPHADMIR